jgi:predicted Fe-Mo cluster-binding NifX family protein
MGKKYAVAQDETLPFNVMGEKILLPLHENDVAPRFDLATEVLIAEGSDHAGFTEHKMVVLPRASADQLCHLAITEGVSVVICGGIEDTYFRYLLWKGIEVVDSVIGPCRSVLKRYSEGNLKSGDILFDEPTGNPTGQ